MQYISEDAPNESTPSNLITPSPRQRAILTYLADRFLMLVMLICFAVAGWSFATNASSSASTTAAVDAPAAAPIGIQKEPHQTQLRTVAIENIRLGQRVQGKNPHRHEVSKPSVINANSWRAIRLTMRQHDVTYQLAFLRSLDWIEAAGAREGGTIRLELAEMGLNGPARVEAIEPCPTIEPDDGTHRMVVSGTMCHLADNILNVYISGLDEPLGVTDTHPIWSETRQDFVVAGQLQVGERLRSETGVISQVTRITPHRGPPELTYNLEVDGEHVYQVEGAGLLVHNNCMLNAAEAERDRIVGLMKAKYGNKVKDFTTVVAGVDTATGKIIVKAKKTGIHPGECAEDLVVRAFGGTDGIKMTQAIRPRNGALVDVCKRCQDRFGFKPFFENVEFE